MVVPIDYKCLPFINLGEYKTKIPCLIVVKPFATTMISRFQGKVAIVTASTEGIGYAMAERLASEGAAIVVSSRKQAHVDKAVEKLRAQGFKVEGTVCHVSKAEHRSRLFDIAIDKFGGLDILISNAAVNPGAGPIFKPMGLYSISKTALLALVKAAAKEMGRDNIRVNGLAPGCVPTKFSRVVLTDSGTQELLEKTALKRLGTAEEMAGAAAFLVSSDAGYVTGEIVVAAGGMTSHL